MSVLVSGATGYIAKHIVNDLLKEGYKVIGTVRSEAKGDQLKKQFGNNVNFTTEVVADIASPSAFDVVFQKHQKDIKVVLHTASPFHFDTTNFEKDLLVPAVNGTKSILESVKKYGADTVERVVITSSEAAMIDLSKAKDSSWVLTEDNWNPDTWESCQSNPVSAYCGSKKFAEKAAWEFLEANKDNVKFKLSTVNPVFVFGPQMFDEDVKDRMNTSCEIVNGLIHSTPEAKLDDGISGDYVDVRDVSKAHLLAFQKDNTVGKRLGLSDGKFDTQDIADILNKDFPQLKNKIAAGDKPGQGAHVTNANSTFDNSKTKELLGFKFIDLEKTIHDTAAQILKKEGRL